MTHHQEQANQLLTQALSAIKEDTYYLTRSEISQLDVRFRDLHKFINDMYALKMHHLNSDDTNATI